MISPKRIIEHLQEYLPQLTDVFSTKLSVTAEIIAGSPQVLKLTSAGYGLQAGQKIIISNSLINNPITAIQFYDTEHVIRFTTNQKHDLTEGYDKNLFDGKIRLLGFVNPDLNNDFELVSVPSQTMFEIQYNYAEHFELSGNEILTEKIENGFNGIQTITSVDENAIYINLTGYRQFEVGAIPQIESIINVKMDVVIDEQTARSLYQGGYHLFLIMEKGVSGKNRAINSDANQLNQGGSEQRQEIINEFSVNIFVPTINELTGANAIDWCWTIMLENILNCLQGVNFSTFDDTNNLVSLLGHGSIIYNKAYYEHSYTFQFVYEITYKQSFLERFPKSVPFERIDFTFHEKTDGSKILLNE